MVTKQCLIAIGQPSHTRHDTENVVIDGIDVKSESGTVKGRLVSTTGRIYTSSSTVGIVG